jgi:hypothetical protein
MIKGLLDAIQDNNSNTIERLESNSKQIKSGLLSPITHSEKDNDEKHKTTYQKYGGLLDATTK